MNDTRSMRLSPVQHNLLVMIAGKIANGCELRRAAPFGARQVFYLYVNAAMRHRRQEGLQSIRQQFTAAALARLGMIEEGEKVGASFADAPALTVWHLTDVARDYLAERGTAPIRVR